MQTGAGTSAVHRLQEAGWLFIVVAIPLVVNPWGIQSFDLPKVSVLRSVVIGLGLLWLWQTWAAKHSQHRPSTGDPTKPVRSPAKPIRLASFRTWPDVLKDPRLWAAVVGLAWALSTAFSLDVGLSFWGSYNRQEGLYTMLSYLLLFGLVATRLHDVGQAERLLFAIVLGGLPVIAYGLMQGAGIDPLAWQTSDESAVLSTLGRSNFVGSYLVMWLPLATGGILLCRRWWL